ncbi:hypothetical protein CN198_14135 [Sinorhizobium meliloti]|uniref:hypothetical protein n=1 Tax=Rhizobium meliloti TaxID=382 RepID=UPI000FDA3C66|nr:hypothetical protein [Sinorhizobium meliloti]RVH69197.1 hypothetical protein CN198_14135 [Sinorhizobium meliloti]
MTKHERNLMAAEDVPALDGATSETETPAAVESHAQQPVEYPGGINPRWDVAQIATRGHVLVGRVEYLSQKLRYPTIWLWLLLIVLTWAMIDGKIGSFGPRLMDFDRGIFQRMLTFEPDSYFDLGGGLKGGPDLAWLGNYAPTPESLTEADHKTLIAAVVADSAKYGTNAEEWEHVGTLKIQPMITRPAKAFAENSAELRNGVIAVPEAGGDIVVSAYVGGRWAFTVIRGDSCASLVGPAVDRCRDWTRNDGWSGVAIEAIKTLKPKE